MKEKHEESEKIKEADKDLNSSQLIDAWFIDWFHGQPGISDVTATFNLLHDAKENLKARMGARR